MKMSVTIRTPNGGFKVTWWGEIVVWLAGRVDQFLKEVNRNKVFYLSFSVDIQYLDYNWE